MQYGLDFQAKTFRVNKIFLLLTIIERLCFHEDKYRCELLM